MAKLRIPSPFENPIRPAAPIGDEGSPPTEPQANPPAVAPQAVTPRAPAVIPGGSLRPNLAQAEQEGAFWYWVGALPTSPMASYTLGGISFPVRNELVAPRRLHGRSGHEGNERVPVAGALVKLSRTQLRRIAEALPRRVVRSTHTTDPDSLAPRMRGVTATVSIPTAAEIEGARQAGRVLRPYEPRSGDRAVADFIYLVRCSEPNPVHRPANAELPAAVSETGIEMPPDDAVPVDPAAMTSDVRRLLGV